MARTHLGIICVVGLTICLALPTTAGAQGILTTSTDLPPDGVYRTAISVHVTYTDPDLEIILWDMVLIPDAGRAVRHTEINNERQDFDSDLTAQASIDLDGSGPQPPTTGLAVLLSGPTETLVTDRMLSTTGTFEAEIVSMELSGNVGGTAVRVRESPTQASTGDTDISDLGGGLYDIDSFFDVFTELSVDDGQTWIASDSFKRMTLVPEPATLGLLALGAVALIRRRK